LRKVLQQNALSQTEPCPDIGAEIAPGGGELPPTSEELIAAALDGGEITYEESLRYRALALFADPRLPEEYASPVIDWEAGTELFGEIDANEGTLSTQLLADLEEFRARPNDPSSIHFDTPAAEGEAVPQGVNRAWRTALVPGTDARVWALGPPGAEQTYVNLVSTVWSHFLGVFAYPNPDQAGDPNAVVNPDGAIDFYFVNPGVDPRYAPCNVPNPSPTSCIAASDYGMARRALPFVSNTSSGYLIANAGQIGADPLADDNLVDTIAHELAHVSQYAYDKSESSWLYESTATWVAYRIMLDMGRTPDYAYDMAERLYDVLDKPLTDETGANPKYRSWLFFQHAAMVAGDDVVSDVWENARPLGIDGIDAVDAAFSLDEHFDDFTVRNWNVKPPLLERYRDAPDSTFPNSLLPNIDNGSNGYPFIGPADLFLDLPVEPLSARYYRYTFGPSVRHIIFENNLVETPGAHVWLLKKISGDWKPPEDMAGSPVQTWCRDSTTFDEDLEELIVVVSFSETSGPALNHHWPRVIGDQIACTFVEGTIRTIIHVQDDAHDVTYDSGTVNVRFRPRDIQDEPGNVQYDLAAGSGPVTWVGSGTYYDECTGEGQSTVAFPGGPFTGIELNAGYFVVVGPGDWHGGIITAFDPSAVMTVTCPGDPPTVTTAAFQAGHLLHILMEPNLDEGPETVYRGNCFYQFGPMTSTFTWDLRNTGVAPSAAEAALPSAPTHCVGFP
jgi:hypothetical protein